MDGKKITQALFKKKIITQHDLEKIKVENADNDGNKILQGLVNNGSVSQEVIALVSSDELDIPFLHVIPELIDWDRWEEYPFSLFSSLCCIPIFEKTQVVIVMSHALAKKDQQKFIDLFSETKVSFAMGTNESILPILEAHKENNLPLNDSRFQIQDQQLQKKRCLKSQPFHIISEKSHEYSPAILSEIRQAISLNATQVHLHFTNNFTKIYYRVNNKKVLQKAYPKDGLWNSYLECIFLIGDSCDKTHFFFEVDNTLFHAHALFKKNSFIVVSLEQDHFLEIDQDVIKKISTIPRGLCVLVSPDIQNIKDFAYAILKRSVSNSKIGCSMEVLKKQELDLVFQVKEDESDFVISLKPDIFYLESSFPKSKYHFLADFLVLKKVVGSTIEDAFFELKNSLPINYTKQFLCSIVVIAKVKLKCDCQTQLIEICAKCNNRGFFYRLITDIVEINTDTKKLFLQGSLSNVEVKNLPKTKIIEQLSKLLKEKKINIDDLSPFI